MGRRSADAAGALVIHWCGTAWGGQPDTERDDAVASFGGDTFVEVDLHVVPDPNEEEECPER